MLNPQVLEDIIRESGISFSENGVSYTFSCPRCKKARKLAIHKEKGYFCCYKCKEETDFKGKKPDLALSELLEIPIAEIRKKLYGEILQNSQTYIDLELKDPYAEQEFNDFTEELSEVSWNPDFIGPESDFFAKGCQYLTKIRGLRQEHIQKYQIKYHPAWKTVVFPVIMNGRLLGWQERGIDRNFKYTMKGLKKENTLMFHDRLLESNHAVLTEGPVDALKCHIVGGNVCSMGKGVSEKQLDIIKGHVNKLYLGLDPDAGIQIDKICRQLSGQIEIYLMPPPNGRKDLGECTEEEVVEQFNRATLWSGQVQIYLKGFHV